MKEKKKKILILSIVIVAVITIIAGSTYAYWQITKTQKTPNDIVAACLNLDLDDASTENNGINLDSAWPISDEDGKELTGYSFTVTNNCNEEINYIVGLNRVEEENYLQDSSIKLQLDDNSAFTYSDLSDIEYSDAENTEYTARVSKQVSVETIDANGTNTHTIKIWVSEDAPVTEQSKKFLVQVFITGGQGIEIPECFTIAENGTITSYNYECGTEVVVPEEINGIQVKAINASSFAKGNMQVYGLYNEETEEVKYVYYYTDGSTVEDFINFAKQNMCENPETCTLADIENNTGLKIITTEEEYNAIDWDGYEEAGYTLQKGVLNFNSETGIMEEAYSQITSLDLSKAIHLEEIGHGAFYASYRYYKSINETCIFHKGTSAKDEDHYRCSGYLEKLIFPKDGALTTIGESAFENSRLTEVVIPSSVTTISDKAFYGRYEYELGMLQKVVFEDTETKPSQITTIGKEAFYRNQISSINFPESLTQIGSSAFWENQIAEVEVNADTIGSNAFTKNKLTKVTIGRNVNSIGNSAFNGGDGYNQITSLTFEDTDEFPSQLISIEMLAFIDNKLTSIKLPRNLETIGYSAFSSNELTKIVIPASVTKIDGYAFSSNLTLTEIIIKRTQEDAVANMTLASEWNWVGNSNLGTAIPVTYNPNYVE